MLFFEPIYLFFFILVLFSYYYFFKELDWKIIIIIFSLIFYSWWNINYLPIILVYVFFNFFFGKLILKNKNKLYLFFSISFNLIILILFKYTDFIIENLNIIFNLSISKLHLPFPLAISFITFQAIAFLINCYDQILEKIKFKDFFLFIIFFPQLIAGPIVLYSNMIKQFNNRFITNFNFVNFNTGLIIFFIGFVKKIYFADILGNFVDQNMLNLNFINGMDAWITSIAYTFQFYFDFTSYVDMAMGSALMLNIILPQNFNSPFKANNIINFWQRWHMTLTSFLTNYLYTPWVISLKKINFIKSMFILFLVFLLAGLWHGPSWNYVIFGFLHGVGLIINHINKKYFLLSINNYFSIICTFLYVNFTFVFFRNKSLDDCFVLIKKMISFNFENFFYIYNKNIYDFYFILFFVLSFIICFVFKNTHYLIENLKDEKTN